MIYFYRMSSFYIKLLKANYNINVCLVKMIVYILMILFSVSLIRYYLYNSIWAILEQFFLARSFIYYPQYLLGLRILHFTCQLTPFSIAIFINNLLCYFGEDDEEQSQFVTTLESSRSNRVSVNTIMGSVFSGDQGMETNNKTQE